MSLRTLPGALRHLFRGTDTPDLLGCTDRELLRRFAEERDESAFVALVCRHGPLVLGVCQRVLRRTADAEDAFQATFLALSRGAASTSWRESVAGWLHDVAWRTATKMKTGEARRRSHEARAGKPLSIVMPDASGDEVGAILDEELRRLPLRYREPLLLCYRQGRTRDEAARQLGLSLRTLHRRLDRGRALLRAFLTRRGVAPASLAALGAVAESPASASVLPPAGLRGATPWMSRTAVGILLVAGIVAALAGAAGWSQRGKESAREETRSSGTAPREPSEERTDRQGDALPEGPIARLGTVRFRGAVAPLRFSPDGKLLASPSTTPRSSEVVLWERATGRPVRRLRANRVGTIVALSFSPDSKRLAVSSGGDTGAVFDVTTGEQAYAFRGGHAVFSGDGKLLFSADPYKNIPQVRLWDAVTGKPRTTWALDEGTEAFSLSADGRTLAFVDRASPTVVRLCDPATGKERRPATLNKPAADRIALSPDGKTLAIAGQAGVSLWDVATGKETRRWKQRSDSGPVFAADGKRVAWMGYDNEVGIAYAWVAAIGDARPHAVGAATNVFAAPDLSPDGKVLAVLTDGRAVVLRDVATGKDLRPFDAHTSPVYRLALAGDGRTLVSGDRNEVLTWDWQTGRLLRRFPAEQPDVESALAVVAGGRLLCRRPDGTVCVREGRTERETLRLEGKYGGTWVAVSQDGSTAGLIGTDGRVRVIDLRTGKVRHRLDAGTDQPVSFGLSLSPGGHFLAWYRHEGKEAPISLTDTRTGRPVRLPGLPDLSRVQGASPAARLFSPDGRWFVVPGARDRLRRWDVRAGKELEPLRGGQPNLFGVFYSPDGRLVATRGNDGQRGVIENTPGSGRRMTVRVWEIATGRLLKHLDPSPAGGEYMIFSADGRTLFTTSGGTIHLWEVATGRERGRLVGHLGSEVTSLLLTRDGRTLLTGGDDAQVLAWDLTGRRSAERASAEQVRAGWEALAGADAGTAYRAMWALAADPERTLPLLRERLRPVPTAGADRVARLIGDLDHERFTVRRRAIEELEELGEPVADALRRALARATRLESRRRIEQVLDEVERPVPSGKRLQRLRAVEVLEHIKSPAARELLTALAEGAAGARLTSEARTALDRLGRP